MGSGAAGAVMAYELARRGKKVIVLEKGVRQDPTTFEHNELAMFIRLYKHSGMQMTSDHDISIAQGSTVGGSTVINNAIWLRPDLGRVLRDWSNAGAQVDRQQLEASYAAVERSVQVSPLDTAVANAGLDVFTRGCAAAGIPSRVLENNREGCIGCGWCNFGCRYNRKLSMLVTFIPWAEARGAQVLDGCDDVTIDTAAGRATAVSFVRGGERNVVSADEVVVCAGAIGSSLVLLQSGIKQRGNVGRGLHALCGITVSADMDTVVNGFDGIGLTALAEAGDECVIETFFSPPLVYSLGLGGWFADHFRNMQRYANYVQGGVMVGTDPVGRVRLDWRKRPAIDLKVSKRDIERLKAGVKTLARIFLAGGARRVLPATHRPLEFRQESDLSRIDSLVRRSEDLFLGTAHPQGGNAMGSDANRCVVGNDFRVHGFDNLFVVDASVFPTNIWANCQATVMALSHYAARYVSSEATL
ncbi:MAG TPA: GMC family oxidoreductase [Dehalococcoidia bacterium]|nr:GMC family oxidoreductase [Dehalococcoidia bacterium]